MRFAARDRADAAVRHRERPRPRRRRHADRVRAPRRSRASAAASPTGSTCAATSTGRCSTTSSGPSGYGPRFGLVAVDPGHVRAHPQAVARPGSAGSPGRTGSTDRLDRSLTWGSHALHTLHPPSGETMEEHMERGTILVVDDEPNIADLVELYLRRDGYRVVKAADRRRGRARGHTPTGPAWSCSTSASPTSTASRCAAGSARPRRSR